MTYEWLNSNFDVRACWDFRTGSAYELKNGIAPTVVGSPRMVPGDGLVYPSTGTTNVHYGDILPLNTSQPFTWIWKVSTFNNWNNSPWSSILNKNGSTNNFYLVQITSTGITIQLKNATDRLGISSFPSKRNSNICIIFAYNGGLKASGCSMFVDGSSMAFSVDNDSLTPAILGSTANFNLGYTGGNLSKSTCFKHFSWLNQTVTPAQATAIYEKLNSEQTPTHRPTRAYSLPIVKGKTPEQYAADKQIVECIPDDSTLDLVGNPKTVSYGDVCNVNGILGRRYTRPKELPGSVVVTRASAQWANPEATFEIIFRANNGTGAIASASAQNNIGITINCVPGSLSTTAIAVQFYLSGSYRQFQVATALIPYHTYVIHGVYNNGACKAYCNGQEIPWSSDTGYYQPNIASTFVLGGRGTTYVNNPNCILFSESAWTRALTASEIRQRYLDTNRILFDGRLPKDGSCPVTPTAITGAGAQIPGTPWKLGGAGNWKIIEVAPVDGKLGDRKISYISSGDYIYAEDNSPPYGSWLIKAKSVIAGSTFVNFIATKHGTVFTPLGYAIITTATGAIQFARTTGSGSVNLFTTAAGYVTTNVMYTFWITRSYDNKFTVWIKGGAYTQFTLISTVGGTGSNPTAADATITTSKYIILYRVGGTGEYGDIIHYSCEITPTEAQNIGLFSNEY